MVLVTAVVNPALVDRWICIPVAADGALALFFHGQRHRLLPFARGFEVTYRGREANDGEGEGLDGVRTGDVRGVIVNVYVLPGPAAGVPPSVNLTSPLSLQNATPSGNTPV